MNDNSLIEKARLTQGLIGLEEDSTAGSVGCALLADNNRVYTGICIDLPSGLGFCAEASAIAEMLKDGSTRILSIVAVNTEGEVIPPCGRCREMIVQINRHNFDANVIISETEGCTLRELLPRHWLFK